jgi:hypothetical protein
MKKARLGAFTQGHGRRKGDLSADTALKMCGNTSSIPAHFYLVSHEKLCLCGAQQF